MRKTLFSILTLSALAVHAGQTVKHDLRVSISPEDGAIAAEDRVSFAAPQAEFIFTLHKGLAPEAAAGRLEVLPAPEAARYGINFSSAPDIYETYRLTPQEPAKKFTLRYKGPLSHPLGEQVEEYARSFSETPGIISREGCYLSGASGWYPHFEGALVSYRLETRLPAPYSAVSGGERTGNSAGAADTVSVWEAARPQDEINLACGPYTEYSLKEDGRNYYAFLRSPDKELAGRYLEAAAKYTRFYSDLIGAYPYGKFALVENFWETGYGIPSFTLLGPKVIRLPFILNSSYPHEILHNWWGNGVFVDYEKGNWCEGLTAYLADYLITESRGKGADYRVAALQKYSDYVGAGKDFPLTEFRSRHSSASEAVGYGKALMVYHMLRRSVGDAAFRNGLRTFYAENKFRYASFGDLERAFEKHTGAGRLKPFFGQWVSREGAPELALKGARLSRVSEGYELEFTLAQKQAGPPYRLEIPAAIYLEGSAQPRLKTLQMDTAEETYHYSAPLRPTRVEIDPEFDVFRKLSPLETPPTLSRVLGAVKPAIFLPAGEQALPWRALADAWAKDPQNLPQVLPDTAAVPGSASYWVFGGGNRLAPVFEEGLERYGARITEDSVTIDNRRFPRAGYTFVFAAFNPSDPAFSGALVLSGAVDKLSLLASKLPHYGKYSWLVFDAGMNSAATGVWTAAGSPLALDLPGAAAPAARKYPARAPLAPLPSVFSAEKMTADVNLLAALPGGRGPGSPGLLKAAALVQAGFKAAGLTPFSGTAFVLPGSNIAGKVEGTSKKDEVLVLCAHYDHLPPQGGAAFPGADDNASGVALLLELARYYGAHPAPRTILFAAFNGEEAGRLGSKAFVAGLPPGAAARFNAALNFDTVGRLDGGKVLALGAGSSDKWVHIFRGAGFVTGVEYDLVKEELDSSDQQSFIEAGIPAVQFFSGPKADYHKITDTADKMDSAGMVKQAEFAREIIDYLAGDSDFITRPSGVPAAGAPAAGPRKASTGLVPDFSFQGKGVRAQDVTPGSPLAAAGFRAGDVVIKFGGAPTDDLRAYSAELKKFSPGQKAEITWLSDGAEKTAELTLAAR
jgi:hypothetical protein